MGLLSVYLLFASSFHLSSQLRLVEPLQDVNVTEGEQAEFVCAVEGRSSDHKIIWFIHNQAANKHCDIDASPTRTISNGDLESHYKVSFTRFEGASVQSIIDGNTERNILVIPAVNMNDSVFRFQCVYFTYSSFSRTLFTDKWVTITVQAAPKEDPTLPTSTSLMQNTSATLAGDETSSSVAIGGSISAVLIILILVVIIVFVFYMKRNHRNCFKKQTKSGSNTVAPSETKATGAVNNGFLNRPNEDAKVSTKPITNTPDGLPTYASSDRPKSNPSDTPIYALPDKRQSSSTDVLYINTGRNTPSDHEIPTYTLSNEHKHTSNTVPIYASPDKRQSSPERTSSSDHEIPPYALPNKRNTVSSVAEKMPVYAQPNKKQNKQNGVPEGDEDSSIYYSQVAVDNEIDDDANLAYSVVNVENETEEKKARNVEGLAYAEVDISSPDDSVRVPTNNDLSTCTYSTVNY